MLYLNTGMLREEKKKVETNSNILRGESEPHDLKSDILRTQTCEKKF